MTCTHMTIGALNPLLIVALTSAAATGGSDLSGLWTLQQERDFRGVRDVTVQCELRQSNETLTVKCGAGSEMKGHVQGSAVTWAIEFESGGDRVTVDWSATLAASGSQMNGTWRIRSRKIDESATFLATRR